LKKKGERPVELAVRLQEKPCGKKNETFETRCEKKVPPGREASAALGRTMPRKAVESDSLHSGGKGGRPRKEIKKKTTLAGTW